MTSDVLPPNPCLVAILLVVRVNYEPRIVFHYPPRPGKDNTHFTRYLAAQEKDKGGTSSTDSDSSSSEDDVAVDVEKPKDLKTGDDTPELDVEEPGSISPEKNEMWNSQYAQTKWNDVFGFPLEALARLLCPPSTAHKERFEMSIGDKVFVGRPMYAHEGEEWVKKKAERKTKAKKAAADEAVKAQSKGLTSRQPSAPETGESTDASERDEKSGERRASLDHAASATNAGPTSTTDSAPRTKAESSKPAWKEKLNLFHVVFVLDPPPLEYQLRVKEMYEHVIKKFSKALKREQARSRYVYREASLLYREAPLMKRALGKVLFNIILVLLANPTKPKISRWPLCTIDIRPGPLSPKP